MVIDLVLIGKLVYVGVGNIMVELLNRLLLKFLNGMFSVFCKRSFEKFV